ncbi:MAG: hypothetical protein LBC95_00950 [Candidatus Nomurabacteria bacterium]|jgi:MraZ protein|nr:hypothetical protein [Candidatus Nomurabacteria bacterium]
MAKTDYFERKLDDKRRLTVPADLRQEFASGIVITRGFGKYLHLYPKDMWDRDFEKFASAVNPFDFGSAERADQIAKFRFGKTEAQLDGKQGRVALEKQQLDYAGISHDIVAVRIGEYWRIMNPEAARAL